MSHHPQAQSPSPNAVHLVTSLWHPQRYSSTRVSSKHSEKFRSRESVTTTGCAIVLITVFELNCRSGRFMLIFMVSPELINLRQITVRLESLGAPRHISLEESPSAKNPGPLRPRHLRPANPGTAAHSPTRSSQRLVVSAGNNNKMHGTQAPSVRNLAKPEPCREHRQHQQCARCEAPSMRD